MKATLTLLLAFTFLTASAQDSTRPTVVKQAGKAKVVSVQGETHLILVTGYKRQDIGIGSYPADIELELTSETWRVLETLLTQPNGNPVTMNDVNGYMVLVARARVFEENGLIFTMGNRNVALSQEDFLRLR